MAFFIFSNNNELQLFIFALYQETVTIYNKYIYLQ